MDRAAKREGMRLGMEKVGLHPIEAARNNARYSTGMQNLLQTHGFGPGQGMQALAQNEDYYNQLRALYDKHMGAPASQPAAEKPTRVLSVSE